MAVYHASKFAVWGLAETLCLEWADEGITVSVVSPSGMLSRHLETSASAQPEHLRRAIGEEADFQAMASSNPAMVRDLASPADAAKNAIDALLAGERYVVTHGDLVDAVTSRCSSLRRAAYAAR